MNPLISIIIPVKNRLSWFEDTLHSVLNQTYSNYELIIVDDGSYPPLIKAIPNITTNKKITVLRNETSVGPGGARELGRQKASGAFVHYLDSDDILHQKYLQKMIYLLESHPEAGMGYCISTIFHELPITVKEKVYQNSDKVLNAYKFDITARRWSTSSCLWAKWATDIIGPWSDLENGEDRVYDFKAECLGIKVVYLPEILCYYRKSLSGGHQTDRKEKLRFNGAVCDFELAKLAAQNKNSIHKKSTTYLRKALNHSIGVFALYGMKQKTLECIKFKKQLTNENFIFTIFYGLIIVIFHLIPYQLLNYLYKKSKFKLSE